MMKLQFCSVTLALTVATVVASDSNGLNLRRTAEQSHRSKLCHSTFSSNCLLLTLFVHHPGLPHPPPHHHSSGSSGSGGTSDYYGCLDLNTTEQAQVWADGPSCDYTNGGNGTTSGNGDSDGSGDDTVTQYEVVDDDTTSNPYEDFVITQVCLSL